MALYNPPTRARFYVNTGGTPGGLVSGEEFVGDDGAGNVARIGVFDENTGTVKELLISVGSSTVYGCRVSNSTGQSLNAGATASLVEAITFDTEARDDGGFHTGSGSKLTVPASADGWYQPAAMIDFGSTTGTREARIYKNGTITGGAVSAGSMIARAIYISGVRGSSFAAPCLYLAAGDYVELYTVTSAAFTLAQASDQYPAFSLVKVA